ncbi:hypothetical protein Vi05172_g3679 [Venturia inaequalis]|nr:hypothetical protein Vi05172_g3679 [Venturia inaequalis]
MKIATLIPTVILALFTTTTIGCATYKVCWCELLNTTYKGKPNQNVPWDDMTQAACREPGKIQYRNMYNHKVCWRFNERTFITAQGIDNCSWKNQCEDEYEKKLGKEKYKKGMITGYCAERAN